MSAAAVAMESYAESDEETLAGRFSRGSLSQDEALRHTIAIAAGLRDLHRLGLVYGAVSSQLILLETAGVCLRMSGGQAQFGDSREDVRAFGAVLGEVLQRSEGSEEFRAELDGLAARCREESPEMRYVLTRLRLLRLRLNTHGKRKFTLVRPLVAPAKTSKCRVRIHLALHWKPLVNLVAAALPGK